MKKIVPFLIFSFSLILNSCSSDIPIAPEDSQQGSISLNIDRIHKPANVVSVKASLTRENFDTLSGTLSLQSDTTADITFNDIAAGGWHLKVEAADEQNTVVYTGEADVNILAGITTDVYLTLEPTGAGFGNIYIYVNWGVPANTNWVDYGNNPIFRVNQIPYFTLGVSQAQIMYDENKYKMWFMNLYYSGYGDISYAESPDGISWHLASSNPVLTAGAPGTWDSYTVGMGYVYKEDGIYRLYYIGTSDHPMYGMRQIGLATSTDGINWTKYPDPVLLANYSEYFMGVHGMVKKDGTYYMYYDSAPANNYEFVINLATSTDGINWTRYSSNPVLVPNQYWEGNSILYPSIIEVNNSLKMVYGNGVHSAVGMAYSSDGINWTKDQGNPFFTTSDVHNGWTYKVSYPFCVKLNDQYRLYYTGTDYNNVLQLGVATH